MNEEETLVGLFSAAALCGGLETHHPREAQRIAVGIARPAPVQLNGGTGGGGLIGTGVGNRSPVLRPDDDRVGCARQLRIRDNEIQLIRPRYVRDEGGGWLGRGRSAAPHCCSPA